MNIDKQLLDDLLAQAAESPRLRMNYDLRTSATSALRQAQGELGSGQALSEDNSQRMLNALLPGTPDFITFLRHYVAQNENQ